MQIMEILRVPKATQNSKVTSSDPGPVGINAISDLLAHCRGLYVAQDAETLNRINVVEQMKELE